MNDLAIKFNFTLNELNIKSAYTDLTKVTQEKLTVAGAAFYNVPNITKMFFLSCDKPVTLKITNPNASIQTLTVTDSFFISGQFTNIKIENPSLTVSDVINVFLVSS